MSDFLTTLVARSLRPLPAVRPRAPLPFEPSPDGPALIWDRPREESGPGAMPAPRPAPPPPVSPPTEDVPDLARTVRGRPATEPAALTPVVPPAVVEPARRTVTPTASVESIVVATPHESAPTPRPSTPPDPKPAGRAPSPFPAPREAREAAPPSERLPAPSETRTVAPSPKARASRSDGGQEVRPSTPPRVVADEVAGRPRTGLGRVPDTVPRTSTPPRVVADEVAEPTPPTDALEDRLRRWLTAMLPPPRPGAGRDDAPASGLAEGPSVRPDVPRLTPVTDSPRTPLAPPGVQTPPLGIRPFLPPAPKEAVREATPPAPVVEVTIGRIEVRAAVSPAKPARRPAAPPVMTLDDYLRRREGVPRE